MEFMEGLRIVYGSHDKGILAIAAMLPPETLAVHAESVELSKPEMIDSLKSVIQNVETGVIQPALQAETPKANPRSESVAQRKVREAREHAAALAESDTVARMVGRNDIEYDLENVTHRSVIAGSANRPHGPAARVHYEAQPRKVRTLTRPHGNAEPKRRREQ